MIQACSTPLTTTTISNSACLLHDVWDSINKYVRTMDTSIDQTSQCEPTWNQNNVACNIYTSRSTAGPTGSPQILWNEIPGHFQDISKTFPGRFLVRDAGVCAAAHQYGWWPLDFTIAIQYLVIRATQCFLRNLYTRSHPPIEFFKITIAWRWVLVHFDN